MNNTFSFYLNIPYNLDFPSDDQDQMLINNNSISGIIEEDHVGFDIDGGPAVTNGGWHNQLSFKYKYPPQIEEFPLGNASSLYPDSGSASSNPVSFFHNKNNKYCFGLIKGFIIFTAGSTNFDLPIIRHSFNVEQLKRSGFNSYQIVVKNNVLVGSFPGIFITGGVPFKTNFVYTNGVLYLLDIPNGAFVSVLFMQF